MTTLSVNASRFLIDAGALLYSSLDYQSTLSAIARLAVPHVADLCMVDLSTTNGKVNRVIVVHPDDRIKSLLEQFTQFDVYGSDIQHGPGRVITTGRTEFRAEITDAILEATALSPEHLTGLRALGLKSGICVPLIARDRTLGAISFAFMESGRRYTEEDVPFLEALARQAALAVDNATLYEQAQNSVRIRDEILSVVSHDLKNPLAAILMSAKLQQRMADNSESGATIRRQAELIETSAKSMQALIHDLLDYEAMSSGHLRINRSIVSVAAILEQTDKLLRPLAEEKPVHLALPAIDATLSIECNQDRLVQVFSNLIGNAIKFSPEGSSIAVGVEISSNEVEFSVSDAGPGIPESAVPRIFDRFWTGSSPSKSATGLGLTIAKQIVEAHGGRIWAKSKLGAGSTFYFSVPR